MILSFLKSFNAAILIAILLLFASKLAAQTVEHDSFLKVQRTLNEKSESNYSSPFFEIVTILFPLNPIFQIENEKFYAGLTKEMSIGSFPYGRLAAEYSVIFRSTRLNQLRFSYNYDIPVGRVDILAFLFSLGVGYYTDFKKNGYFPQTSFGLLIPLDNKIAVNTYLKVRNTFMTQSNESDIFDVSLGLATQIYF